MGDILERLETTLNRRGNSEILEGRAWEAVAEIKKLRAALKSIERQCYEGDPVKEIARQALNG